MSRWLRERALPVRILVYVAAAAVVFAVSAGLGAMGALMLRDDLALPGTEEPRPLQEDIGEAHQDQEPAASDAAESEQEHAASDTAAEQSEADYIGKVGGIQAESVGTFLDSHDKLLRYDALSAEDVEKMQSDRTILREASDRVDELDPPEKYEEHHEAFRSAVRELHEAARLAYILAADPTAATRAGFEEYDRHVGVAADRLRRSNEILGRDFETIEGVREVSPL
jgi:hypothetical protein